LEGRQESGKAGAAAVSLPAIESIAFFGNNYAFAEDGICVQILCWPTTAIAWHSLTQSWRVLRTPGTKQSPAVHASWVHRHASQLCTVFNEVAALETSVAALIARASIGMSVALGTTKRPPSQREMFADCLLGYQEFLRTPGRTPWAAAVVDTQEGEESVEPFFRSAIHGIPFQAPPALYPWGGTTDPIPLEVARVAAGSIARYLSQRNTSNSIFEAVLTKLVKIPAPLTQSTRSRRR
jgi:hypothetical protein